MPSSGASARHGNFDVLSEKIFSVEFMLVMQQACFDGNYYLR